MALSLTPVQEAPDLSDLPAEATCPSGPGSPFSRGPGVPSLAGAVVQRFFSVVREAGVDKGVGKG